MAEIDWKAKALECARYRWGDEANLIAIGRTADAYLAGVRAGLEAAEEEARRNERFPHLIAGNIRALIRAYPVDAHRS